MKKLNMYVKEVNDKLTAAVGDVMRIVNNGCRSGMHARGRNLMRLRGGGDDRCATVDRSATVDKNLW